MDFLELFGIMSIINIIQSNMSVILIILAVIGIYLYKVFDFARRKQYFIHILFIIPVFIFSLQLLQAGNSVQLKI